jgi:hypothetical protein
MKYLIFSLLLINSVIADSKKMGMKVPDIKLDSGNTLMVEQHLKKINAFDNADKFKLDFYCTKKNTKSKSRSPANLDCKLINID